MKLKTSMSISARAALKYTEFGWAVFPCANRGKTPITRNGFKGASVDEIQIERWFQEWPYANVGVATGQISNIAVLDIDHRADLSAHDALLALEAEIGALPPTPHVLTGGGGYQFYFRCSEPLRSRISFRKQCDLKADGGYVVVPPSVHPTGKKYEWEAFHRIDKVPLAELPTRLRTVLEEGPTAQAGASCGSSVATWQEVTGEGARAGARNDTTARLAGYLLHKGIDCVSVLNLVSSWNKDRNKPPLEELEVRQVVNSVAKSELRKRQTGGN